MTITMTAKHQITIPKRIADTLCLAKGTLFKISVHHNRIELTPLEAVERTFTDDEYERLEALASKERGREKRVTTTFIRTLKTGKG